MDRFAAMSVFVCRGGRRQLSAASRALRMPLPTVSRHVAELERTSTPNYWYAVRAS